MTASEVTEMADEEIKERLADEIASTSRHNTDSDYPRPTETIRQVGPSPQDDSYDMEDAYAGETQQELGDVEDTGEEPDPGVFAAGGVNAKDAGA